jgi:alginate O-acetyltransferase complex protein AlgI
MIELFLAFITYWCLLIGAAFVLPNGVVRKMLGWFTLVAYILVLLLVGEYLHSWQRLFLSTIGLLLTIKIVALLQLGRDEIRSFPILGLAMYSAIWPGFDPQPFKNRNTAAESFEHKFVHGYVCFVSGLLACLAVAILQPSLGTVLTGWAGIGALLLTIHFGFSNLLTSMMQLSGWNVRPLFEQPMRSRTLGEFWSKRWNLAFVEMDKILFLPVINKVVKNRAAALVGVFLVSGLLHELAINYSSGSAMGLPTLYFLLQAIVLLTQEAVWRKRAHPILARVVTWLCIILPLPMLFTDAFRNEFILPLFQLLHSELAQHQLGWYLSLALWLASAGNFCAIAAGIQIPYRLNWREELPKLSSFNRKIFLNYYFYIGVMVLTWGSLTAFLHDDMLRGGRSSVCLAGIMAGFWTLRVVVDFVFFKHSDWPKGAQFVIGHVLLTSLFIFLATSYLGLVLWQVFGT